jgi:hypothetical protein
MSENQPLPDDLEQFHTDWWRALRFAYEILPIVKDVNALSHIASQLPEGHNFVMNEEVSGALGRSTLLALVDAGENGQLDQALLVDEWSKGNLVTALAPFVANYVDEKHLQDEAIERATHAFEKVQRHLHE